MSDIYTKEMRINHEACPICGFWHTALSCPPQVAGMSNQILALRSEVERLKGLLGYIKQNIDFVMDGDKNATPEKFWLSALSQFIEKEVPLNSFQNGNSLNSDTIAKTRLTYNADTVTLEIKKADRGDYLLIQNLWQYSYYDTLEEAMENYEHKRDLFLGQGYKESEEK